MLVAWSLVFACGPPTQHGQFCIATPTATTPTTLDVAIYARHHDDHTRGTLIEVVHAPACPRS